MQCTWEPTGKAGGELGVVGWQRKTGRGLHLYCVEMPAITKGIGIALGFRKWLLSLLGFLLHCHLWVACLQEVKDQGSALAWTLRCSDWVRMFFRYLPALRLEGGQVEWGRGWRGDASRAKVPGSKWTWGQTTAGSSWLWLTFVLYSFLRNPFPWFLIHPLNFLFWGHCRFACHCNKSQRQMPCTLYPVYPNDNILQNHSLTLQPGAWHWCNLSVSLAFPQFDSYSCVFVCACLVLCNFITWESLCIHHYSEDTNCSNTQRSLHPLSQHTPALALSNH